MRYAQQDYDSCTNDYTIVQHIHKSWVGEATSAQLNKKSIMGEMWIASHATQEEEKIRLKDRCMNMNSVM